MRLFALLLLAAAAGFAVGRLTAPEVGGRGGGRRAALAADPVRQREDEVGPDSSAQAASRVDPEPASTPPSPDVVRPAGALDEPSSEGLIEVDFDGYDGERQAWVGWRSIQGGLENWEDRAEEGSAVVRFSLEPGVYDVWWLDGQDGGRRGARAAVEAGQLTRVRVRDHPSVLPVPDGLGILDLEVTATWGGGLETWVDLICSEEATVGINARGQGSAALYPGRYGLVIGDHRDEVEIAAGCTTSRRIAHAKEGDLIFENTDQFDIGIGRSGEPVGRRLLRQPYGATSSSNGDWTGVINGVPRRGFVYLAEGGYDVFLLNGPHDKSGVPLGRAVVRTGQTTWFRYEAPRGGIVVRVLAGGVPRPVSAQVAIRQVGDGRAEEGATRLLPGPEGDFKATLAPGRYAVTASCDDCEPTSAELDVADRVVELTLDLPRLR